MRTLTHVSTVILFTTLLERNVAHFSSELQLLQVHNPSSSHHPENQCAQTRALESTAGRLLLVLWNLNPGRRLIVVAAVKEKQITVVQ